MTEWFVFVVLRAPNSSRASFFEAMAASTLAASSTMQSAYLYKYKDVRANRPHEWLLLRLLSSARPEVDAWHLVAEVRGKSVSMAP